MKPMRFLAILKRERNTTITENTGNMRRTTLMPAHTNDRPQVQKEMDTGGPMTTVSFPSSLNRCLENSGPEEKAIG